MKNKFLLLIISIFVVINIISCSKVSTNTSHIGNTVKITPSTLFQGNLKILEPHLDMTTGCVMIDYTGNKMYLGLEAQLWENGKILESYPHVKMIEGNFQGTVSISLKDILNSDLESSKMIMTTAIQDDTGHSSSKIYIKKCSQENYSTSPNIIEETERIDTEEIFIWGLMANDTGIHSSSSDIEETAKKMNWAVTLKLFFKDEI